MTVNGDIVRAAVIFEVGAALATQVNTWYLQVVDDTGITSDAAFAALVQDYLFDEGYDLIVAQVSNTVSANRVEMQNITQNFLYPVAGSSWVGTSAGERLPEQVSALVYWRTLRPKTRMSKYLPSMTEAAYSPNGWGATPLTQMELFGDAFVGVQTIGTNVDVRFGAYNVGLDRFTPAVSRHVPSRARTQRRRRIGVGI